MTAETHRPFSSWLIWCYRKSISPAWKKQQRGFMVSKDGLVCWF